MSFLSVFNKKATISNFGFLYGVVYNIEKNELLEYPLSTLFGSLFGGIMYAIGSSIIASFLPEEIRFIVPLSLTISISWLKYNEYKQNNTNKNTQM